MLRKSLRLNNMDKPTPADWQEWYAHTSNKERVLEADERKVVYPDAFISAKEQEIPSIHEQ